MVKYTLHNNEMDVITMCYADSKEETRKDERMNEKRRDKELLLDQELSTPGWGDWYL